MKNLKAKQPNIRYVLGIDPSGNFDEGKGTTGWCLFDRNTDSIIKCGYIQASNFETQMAYWGAHTILLEAIRGYCKGNGKLVVSLEDYLLYAKSAQSQTNSRMETCQIIGVIKYWLHCNNIPLYVRKAAAVKRRWTDNILCNKNYIRKVELAYYTQCKAQALKEHERDAIRHAVHCSTFELEAYHVSGT